jgi:hypothetical protein
MKSKLEIGLYLSLLIIINISMYNYFCNSSVETFIDNVFGKEDSSCKCIPEENAIGIPEAITMLSDALKNSYNIADKNLKVEPVQNEEDYKPKKPKFKTKGPGWFKKIIKPIIKFLEKIYKTVSKIIIGIIKGIISLIPFKKLKDYLKDSLKPEGNIVKAIFNLSIGIFKSVLLIGVLPWLLFFICVILVFMGIFAVLSAMINFIRFMLTTPKPNLEGDVSTMKNELEELKNMIITKK